MDADRFDLLVHAFARRSSRRGILRVLGAGGLGTFGILGVREVARACTKNGNGCDRNKAEQCCSGTCKKKGGKFKCVKAKGAFGCTNQKKNDICEDNIKVCPNNPEGFCVVDEKKRPYCIGSGACFACNNGLDCVAEYGVAGLRCIKQCGGCPNTGGRLCVAPPGVN